MMSPKISFLLLLHPTILLVAFLVPSSRGATYQDFARKHIDHLGPGNTSLNAYCNLMMRQRGMIVNTCKDKNDFIRSLPIWIVYICRGGGTHVVQNLYDSKQPYDLTCCRNRGRYPNCNYVGEPMHKRIRMGCDDMLPVHFEKHL